MNHLDRGHRRKIGDRPRLLRLSVVGGLAAVTLAVSLPGAALAGNAAKATPYSGASGVSAAQDQYGKHRVIKPHRAVSGVKAAKVTAKSPASALPFTGLALLKVVLTGLGLVALGFALRRWPARGKNR